MIKDDLKIDFIGIGAPKCATTWIYDCLKEHPQISLLPKDQHEDACFYEENSPGAILTQYYEEYPEDLNESVRLIGEFMVNYLISERTPEIIKSYNPNMKLIVSFRNPVERAHSYYRHLKFAEKREWGNFEEAIKKDPGEIIEPGFYYKHLKKFQDHFPKENIHIVFYKDVQEKPLRVVQDIYKFLEADTSFIPRLVHTKINPSRFKFATLGRLIHEGIIPLLDKTGFGYKIKSSPLLNKFYYGLAESYVSKKDPTSSMKRTTRQYLMEVYRNDVKNLEKLTNRNLESWK